MLAIGWALCLKQMRHVSSHGGSVPRRWEKRLQTSLWLKLGGRQCHFHHILLVKISYEMREATESSWPSHSGMMLAWTKMVGREKWTDLFFFKGYFRGRIKKSWGLFWNKEERIKLQMTPRSLAWVTGECPAFRGKRGRTGLGTKMIFSVWVTARWRWTESRWIYRCKEKSG